MNPLFIKSGGKIAPSIRDIIFKSWTLMRFYRWQRLKFDARRRIGTNCFLYAMRNGSRWG